MTFSNWLLLFSLYVTQFLPIAFFFMALPTILRDSGASLDEISLFYLLGFVWVFKFLWAPLVDRIEFGRLGHYRAWLMLMQAALSVLMLIVAQTDGPDQIGLLFALGLLAALVSGTQDIAADAICCRLLPPGLQGLGSSVQLGGNLLAMILGGGLVLLVYKAIGWSACAMLIAAAILPVLVQIALFDEHKLDCAARLPGARVSYARLWSFWSGRDKAAWALILIFVPIATTMALALASPLLVDLGWQPDEIGVLLYIIGPGFGILGGLVVGLAITKLSKWGVLAVIPIFQAIAVFAMLRLTDGAPSGSEVYTATLLVMVADVVLFTALTAIMLGYAKAGTEGTDFTVQNSFYSFFAFAAGIGALQFAEASGYDRVLIGCLAACALFGTAAALYAAQKHRNQGAAAEPVPAQLPHPPALDNAEESA